jgi:hypothetical protein
LSSSNINSPTQDASYFSHDIQPTLSSEPNASTQAPLDNTMSSPLVYGHETARVSSPIAQAPLDNMFSPLISARISSPLAQTSLDSNISNQLISASIVADSHELVCVSSPPKLD